MEIFVLFLLTLAVGSISTLFWIPEDDLGRGYFQMNALIILGLVAIALTVLQFAEAPIFGARAALGRGLLIAGLIGSFLYYAGVWRQSWTQARWAAAATLVILAVATWVEGSAVIQTHASLPIPRTLLALNLGTSALMLGWALITMLLGHWYLVAPRLTFRHLTVFCWVLIGVVALRTLVVFASLYGAATVDAAVEPHPWRLLTGFAGEGMFFWFRMLWGLGIPITLSYMSLQCARNRSNQSATGILYVLVVGVLVGEITGYYLSATTGVPS